VGISVVLLIVIFGGLAAASALLTTTVTETKNFSVGSQPTVVLNNGNGSVHIINGSANHVTVVAHKHVLLGDGNQISVQYDLNSSQNTLTVTVPDQQGFSLFNWNHGVDFDVTVPAQANLHMETGNGSVDATGINGQISLETGNGSIDVTQVNGPMTLKTGNGSITTTQTGASGNSTFKTGNGSIDFNGTLNPNNGTYLFTTGNGSIDVTLPGNSSFQFAASTGNGSIDSDFPSVGSDDRDSVEGTVGSAPYAQVTLRTGNGSIHLHQGN
jgi:hypothetical protein